MFGLHFIKEGLISRDLGRFFNELYDKRQMGDYDDFVELTKDNVTELMPIAKQLIEEVENQINKKLQ